MGKLYIQTISTDDLSSYTIDSMWKLFEKYYDCVSFTKFFSDLTEKNYVLIAREKKTKQVKGFTTVKVYNKTFNGRPSIILFSGDTIMDQAYWGCKGLHIAFFFFLMRLKFKNPFRSCYWFLISKGYKTYLALARNFTEYWPRYDKATPRQVNNILDDLATDRFGSAWKPEIGLLQFPQCEGKLKRPVAPISREHLKHPEIAYFQERNPGHQEGDELCCLGKINFSLFFYYPIKLLRQMAIKIKKLKEQWA